MFPILLQIGPITIRTYGAMVAIAFLASLHLGRLAARRYKIGEAFFLDLVALLIISGLLGARILYIFLNLSYFRDHPWESFKVWEGGLVFYGGFLLAALVGVIFTRYRGYGVAEIADICAPGLSLGQAIGRWGCFFAGCCYGKPTPLPWGVRFKDPSSLAPLGVQLHPVQIYESIGNLLIAGLLWMMLQRRKDSHGQPGEIFWLYVLLYGILRFAMETFRGDDRGPMHGGLAPSQIIALIAILISGSILLVQKTTQHDAHA
jgi:phosphatidylglycerol:prolipoprotein diacylglycerol transferase